MQRHSFQFDAKSLEYFRDWNGELRFVQNIKVRRYKKKDLTGEQKEGEELIEELKEDEELSDEQTDGEEETEETATSCEMETI